MPAHAGVVRWRTRACTCRRGEVAYAYVQTPRGPVGTLSAAGARITHAHDDPVEHARRLVPPNAFAEYGRIVRMSTRGRPAAFDDAHRRAPFGSPFTRPSMDPEGTGDHGKLGKLSAPPCIIHDLATSRAAHSDAQPPTVAAASAARGGGRVSCERPRAPFRRGGEGAQRSCRDWQLWRRVCSLTCTRTDHDAGSSR